MSRYPLNQATPTTYYLQPSSSALDLRAEGDVEQDELIWDGSEIPCTTSTEQWAAGLGVLALSFLGISDPCTKNAPLADRARYAELHDRTVQAGDDAGRADRRDALRDLHHERHRVGRAGIRRRAGRHRDAADLGLLEGDQRALTRR